VRLLLTLDLGVAGCGACLYDIDADEIVKMGGVSTSVDRKLPATADDFRRLGLVLDFLQEYRDACPVGIAFEAPAGAQSANAAKHLATGRTTAFMIAREDGVDWRAYSVAACKKAVGMKGTAKGDKSITQKAVMDRWPMARWPLGQKHLEDAADAAAVILAAEKDGFIDLLRDKWKHLM